MWIESNQGRELIIELSKAVVAEEAPEELDMFDELIAEYFRDPNPPSLSTRRDDPLGFGVDELIVAVTTAAAAMTKVVLDHLTKEVIKAADEESREMIKEKIRAAFGAGKNAQKQQVSPPLSYTQLKLIHRLAVKEAISFGISERKAQNLAKALVGSLSLRP